MTQANFNIWTELFGHRRMADLLIETIHKAGATHVFAMPAESLNPIIDAIRKDGRLQIVTVRHEGNGALMASAYAKLTGRLGVCMGTAGPGETHLPIGVYDAKADGAPLLAVSGQVPIHQVGSGGFQEIGSLALFQDSASFNRLVASVRQTALLPLACAHALHQRTPVHLAFPSDVLASRIEPRTVVQLHPEWLVPRPALDENLLRQAGLRLSGKGGNTLVLVGAVDAEVREAVEKIAAQLMAPILVLPEGIHYLRHQPQYPTVRLTGRPNDPARDWVRLADRILVIGPMSASISELLSPLTQVVQVAPAKEVARPVYGGILRLAGTIPELLLDLGRELTGASDGKLLRQAETLVDAKRSELEELGRQFWDVLDQVIPENAVLALEPGLVLESAFIHLCIRNRTVTSSFNHGARGYAFPAAMAATIAHPERSAFAITSEEGLAEAMADLLSARKYGLPVKTICLERHGEDALIDFFSFARASGIEVHRAQDQPTLVQAIKACGDTPLPSLICAPAEALFPPASPQLYQLGDIRNSTLSQPERTQLEIHGLTFGTFLIEALVRAGVTRVYGRPRSPLESLRQALEKDTRIGFVPVHHGESASMMASAHSKWTGQPAVCVAADEPDLLLQLNGLYDAAFDRNPVIVITGRGSDRQHSQTGCSSLDPEQLLSDVAASSLRISPNKEAVSLLAQALEEAVRSRTVIHLSLDWNELGLPGPTLPAWFDPVIVPEPLLPPAELLQEATERLSQAHRPAILVGRGATGAHKEIEEIASLLQAPIVTTMPGRGVIPDDYPHMVGAIGASGHRAAIETLERCDVLLVLGSSNRGAIFGFNGRFLLIQIDRDPLQLGRRPYETLGLYGSTKETLRTLIEYLRSHHVASDDRLLEQRKQFLRNQRQSFERWLSKVDRIRNSWHRPIRPPAICHTLQKVLADLGQRAILTVDVGVTTLWVYRHFVGDHDFVWTSSFATMGFSLPAAIAIRELEPSRPVIAMAGDGGIGITMAELATAVRHQIPIVAVVFNNSKLAAIKYEQEVMGWPEYESYLFNCNFAEYAQACGAHGIRVTDPLKLEQALREALTCGKPCIVDVVCDPHEMPAPPKIHPLQGVGYLLALSREFRLYLRSLFRRTQGPIKVPTRYNDNDVRSPRL